MHGHWTAGRFTISVLRLATEKPFENDDVTFPKLSENYAKTFQKQ